jgi:hypothetical protein
MLGIRDDFQEDNDFSPTEAVFVSHLVLTGQFVNMAKSPLPSFLEELQIPMAGLTPPPRLHYSSPALIILPEEMLLARFMLVLCDAAASGPSRMLEQSTHFFHLQIADRTDKVSTLLFKHSTGAT